MRRLESAARLALFRCALAAFLPPAAAGQHAHEQLYVLDVIRRKGVFGLGIGAEQLGGQRVHLFGGGAGAYMGAPSQPESHASFTHRAFAKRRRRPALGLKSPLRYWHMALLGMPVARHRSVWRRWRTSIASRRRFAVISPSRPAMLRPPFRQKCAPRPRACCPGGGAFVMKSITCRFRKDNILKWGKNGKNRAKPSAGGPAACAPPARRMRYGFAAHRRERGAGGRRVLPPDETTA